MHGMSSHIATGTQRAFQTVFSNRRDLLWTCMLATGYKSSAGFRVLAAAGINDPN